MSLRDEVESMLGSAPAKPAKIRQSYPRIGGEAPSHWRKTLKAWASVALFVVLVGFTAGYLSVFFTH
jgi:hypothetical protein